MNILECSDTPTNTLSLQCSRRTAVQGLDTSLTQLLAGLVEMEPQCTPFLAVKKIQVRFKCYN
jgi:hypothetical protein